MVIVLHGVPDVQPAVCKQLVLVAVGIGQGILNHDEVIQGSHRCPWGRVIQIGRSPGEEETMHPPLPEDGELDNVIARSGSNGTGVLVCMDRVSENRRLEVNRCDLGGEIRVGEIDGEPLVSDDHNGLIEKRLSHMVGEVLVIGKIDLHHVLPGTGCQVACLQVVMEDGIGMVVVHEDQTLVGE